MAWDNTSWGVQSYPKDSIPKIQENLRILKEDGVASASTLGGKTLAQIYSYTDGAIASLVHGAPEMLDTLYELSNAIGNDPNFAATMTALIGTKAPLNSPTFTGTVTFPQDTSIGTTTATELGYLHGVTSNIQTQLGLLAPKANPIFSGSVKATGKMGIGASDFSGSNFALAVDQGINILTPGASVASNMAGLWFTKDYTTYNGFNWQLGSNYSANMYVGTGSDWINRMTILPNGNVGMGTTNPTAQLTTYTTGVYNSTTKRYIDFTGDFAGANADTTSNDGAFTGIRLGYIQNGKYAMIGSVSEDDTLGYSRRTGLSFWTSGRDSAPIERMRIASNGNVGIGGANPQATLHSTGSTILGCPTYFVGGSNLPNGQLEFCIDQTNKKILFHVRCADGTNLYGNIPVS